MSAVGSGRVKTFSIGFHDETFNELPFARTVAKRLGTDHHDLILEPNVAEFLHELAWDLDEPFGDASAIPTYIVSKMAAQHVKVVLSGDGGDELFAGYTEYLVESRERWARFLPLAARRGLGMISDVIPDGVRGKNWLHHFSLSDAERYLDANTMFKRAQRRRLLTQEIAAHLWNCHTERSRLERLTNGQGHWLSTLQSMDLDHYLPLDILTKVDRMSMAHSLEARVPLLDHTFVEFAATIPAGWKLRRGRTKHIFVKALRGWLPDEILNRPKQGFAVPLDRWFRGPLRTLYREILLSDTCRKRGIFDPEFLHQLFARQEQGRQLDPHIWTLLSFELWCRTFLDRRSAPLRQSARRPPPAVNRVAARSMASRSL
jgi:asparagine synthase (glutamine-hydrolysing)